MVTGQIPLIDVGLPRKREPFDEAKAAERKRLGMRAAAIARARLLVLARLGCERAALERPERTATADDAYAYLIDLGLDPAPLKNAAGSLFKTNDWKAVGWTESTRATNNGRAIRVWQYSPKPPRREENDVDRSHT